MDLRPCTVTVSGRGRGARISPGGAHEHHQAPEALSLDGSQRGQPTDDGARARTTSGETAATGTAGSCSLAISSAVRSSSSETRRSKHTSRPADAHPMDALLDRHRATSRARRDDLVRALTGQSASPEQLGGALDARNHEQAEAVPEAGKRPRRRLEQGPRGPAWMMQGQGYGEDEPTIDDRIREAAAAAAAHGWIRVE